MPTANLSYTASINAPGLKPLTQAQVWQALTIKVRDAHQFVATIQSTRVLDEGTATPDRFPAAVPGTPFISREATFAPGAGPPDVAANGGKMVEHCFLYEPNRVDFIAPNGNYVVNIVGLGPGGRARPEDGADDLQLTYGFTWNAPEGDDLAARRAAMEQGAKAAVEHSIVAMRELVEKGVVAA